MIILKNADVIKSGNETEVKTVLVEDGKIAKILNSSEKFEVRDGDEIIDCTGKLLVPSFIDSHVHLREPGFEQKETIKTGTRAALRGGYTRIFAMPNTRPVPDSVEIMNDLRKRAKKDGIIDVEFFSALTIKERGQELVNIEDISDNGVIGFSDDGRGVQSTAMMLEAMRRVAEKGGIISAHTEDESVPFKGYITDGEYSKKNNHRGILNAVEDLQIGRDLILADTANCRYHICHMSTKRGAELLELGQKWGAKVSGEVSPHHLLLNESHLKEDGNFKMNPPLRTKEDNRALIKALNTGVIKCIATDHAPHSEEEKSKGLENSPFGIVGLETSFPLLYKYLVETGEVSLETLVNAMGKNVAEVFSLERKAIEEGLTADLTLIDLNKEYEINSDDFESMGKNTPFKGWKVKGFVDTVMHRGIIKMRGGKING